MCAGVTTTSAQANSSLIEVSADIYQRGGKKEKKKKTGEEMLIKNEIGTTIKDEAIAF